MKARREAATFLSTFVGGLGELIVDTSNDRVQVHDGMTPGGFPAAKLSEVPALGPNGALPVATGGTGATSAAAALLSLGAAASGSNNDITALLALAAPGTFTPVVTAATPADLTVSYATQVGIFARVGRFVFVYISLAFTPTYSTASGQVRITGLPAPAHATAASALMSLGYNPQAFPGATGTMVWGQVMAGTSYVTPVGQKSGAAGASAALSQFVSGTAATMVFAGIYLASASF